jgi:hypothetical protein
MILQAISRPSKFGRGQNGALEASLETAMIVLKMPCGFPEGSVTRRTEIIEIPSCMIFPESCS